MAIALAVVLVACGDADPPISTVTGPADTPTTSSPSTTIPVATATTAATTTTTSMPDVTAENVRTPTVGFWDKWTLVLASVEIEDGSFETAEAIAAELDGAMILWSDEVPSLNPDYWVVYWGEFESGHEASAYCSSIPEELTCYPRYIGNAVSPLSTDGNALIVDGQALVIADVASGERLKTFDPYFDGDGRATGRMALTPDASVLYFGTGWEDSWYSCEASQGQVLRYDLTFGGETFIASGFSPTVSPDGHWLALLVAEQCLPDPEQPDSWVITPTDTIVLYDLTTPSPSEVNRWKVTTPPTSYFDPQMLTWIDWRADSQTLVVVNNARSVFEITTDHQGAVDAETPIANVVHGWPQALIADSLYLIRDETPEAIGAFDLVVFDLSSGSVEAIASTTGWPYAAADVTRTKLIWGADTEVKTNEGTFGLKDYLFGLAW